MSSWANIYIPKKRNLETIPSQYQAEIKPSTAILHFIPNVIPSALKNEESIKNITTPHESYVKAFKHLPSFIDDNNNNNTSISIEPKNVKPPTNIIIESISSTNNTTNKFIEENEKHTVETIEEKNKIQTVETIEEKDEEIYENIEKNKIQTVETIEEKDEQIDENIEKNKKQIDEIKEDSESLEAEIKKEKQRKVRIIKKIRKIKIRNDEYDEYEQKINDNEVKKAEIGKECDGEGSETEEEEVETSDEERNTVYNPKYYFPSLSGFKINGRPGAASFELTFKGYSYVFVILRNLGKINDNVLWIRCYNSIRNFYKNKIIIIDDNSSINTYDDGLYNVQIIRSKFKGAAEILPYYYYLKYQWADRMIFLQDSMFLTRLFYPSEMEGELKFLWYTENQESEFNNDFYSTLKLLDNNKYLLKYMNDNTKWYGCFGGTTICSLDIIKFINNEYNIFIGLVSEIKNKSQRKAFQKLLGLIFFNEGIVTLDNCSIYNDIKNYPGAFNKNIQFDKMEHIVNAHGYNTAIIKLWRGR